MRKEKTIKATNNQGILRNCEGFDLDLVMMLYASVETVLQDAAPLRLLGLLLHQRAASRVLKHLTHSLVGLGRALEVPLGPDDLLDSITLRMVSKCSVQ
jgi:hypothetical protein